MILLASLLACEPVDGTDDAAEPSTSLTDENNYTFDSTLTIPSLSTHEAADVTICWDQVAHDRQCHDFAPASDVLNVGLLRSSTLTQDAIEEALGADDLQQADISGYVQFTPEGGDTCAELSEFSFFGTTFSVADEYVAAGGTFMVILSDSDVPGQGARSLAFLSPEADSTLSSVGLDDGCGIVEAEAQLTDVEPRASRLPLRQSPGTA
jgi:hypothetical protein